jgi:hypothetical protein
MDRAVTDCAYYFEFPNAIRIEFEVTSYLNFLTLPELKVTDAVFPRIIFYLNVPPVIELNYVDLVLYFTDWPFGPTNNTACRNGSQF